MNLNPTESASQLKKTKITLFIAIWLGGIIVILLRMYQPLFLGWDESIQIEAAYRMAKGLGYTSTYFTVADPDINKNPAFYTITWWPPGFALLVSGFLAFKIPLWVSLKIIFGLSTLVGWTGWSYLGARFLSPSLTLNMKWLSPLNILIAMMLPFYFTPSWHGTDVMLWAAMPVFIALLGPALQKTDTDGRYALLSGALFGSLFFVRYASLFLGLVAVVSFFFINRKSWKNYIYFCLSALGILAALHAWNFSVSGGTILPQYISKAGSIGIGKTLSSILHDLSSVITLCPVPGASDLLHLAQRFPALNCSLGIFCVLILASLPWIILRLKPVNKPEPLFGEIFALSLLPICLILQLVAVTLVSNPFYPFVGDIRYYWPLIPANFIFLYALISRYKINYYASSVVLIIILTGVSSFYVDLVKNAGQTNTVPALFSRLAKIDSRTYTGYEKEEVFLNKLADDNPAAQFFVQSLPFLLYKGDNTRFRPIPERNFWDQAYLTVPTRMFWVISTERCSEICPTTAREPVLKTASIPGIKEIYFNPSTYIRILVADLPRGYKFNVY